MPAPTPEEILDGISDALISKASEVQDQQKAIKLKSASEIGATLQLGSEIANGTQIDYLGLPLEVFP